jgi:hypothetical protein
LQTHASERVDRRYLAGVARAATFQARRRHVIAWFAVVRRSRVMTLPVASVSVIVSNFS